MRSLLPSFAGLGAGLLRLAVLLSSAHCQPPPSLSPLAAVLPADSAFSLSAAVFQSRQGEAVQLQGAALEVAQVGQTLQLVGLQLALRGTPWLLSAAYATYDLTAEILRGEQLHVYGSAGLTVRSAHGEWDSSKQRVLFPAQLSATSPLGELQAEAGVLHLPSLEVHLYGPVRGVFFPQSLSEQ